MSKRVLITGSEGFTGKYVSAELTQAGWEVWGAGLQPKPDDRQYLQIDLLQIDTLKPIADKIKPDVVIHLAAIAFVAESDPNIFYQVNLIGTRNLLEVLANTDAPPECTILASSANVYGNSALPLLSEEAPVNPSNDYAVSKLAMEYLAKTFMSQLGVIITRPFNYTGVGQSEQFLLPKLISHFRTKRRHIELGNLDVARDFSDVRDVARDYLLLAEKRPINATFNLCSGVATTLNECISICTEVSGHNLEIRVNPSFVRQNEVKMLRGDKRKLDAAHCASSQYCLRDTISWMLQAS